MRGGGLLSYNKPAAEARWSVSDYYMKTMSKKTLFLLLVMHLAFKIGYGPSQIA